MQQVVRRFLMVSGATLAATGLLAACSSGDHHETKGASPGLAAAGAGTEEVSCAADPRVDVFAEGLSKTGDAGVSVTLNSSEPQPPARGDNTWSVTVLGADGEPVPSARLVVSARMPDHGHMSPTTPKAEPTDAQGRTTISNLNLFMAGVWVVDLSILPPDSEDPMDSVGFAFCVEG